MEGDPCRGCPLSVSAGIGFQKGKPPVPGEGRFIHAGQGLPARAFAQRSCAMTYTERVGEILLGLVVLTITIAPVAYVFWVAIT